MNPEEASETVGEHLGHRDDAHRTLESLHGQTDRRGFLRIGAAAGVGAALPAVLTAGAGTAVAAPRGVTRSVELPLGRRRGVFVLQPGQGHLPGTYVPSTLENIRWGHLPTGESKPVATVRSGALVTFDTVSHEGILEDQGRDPARYFGSHGVPRRAVLRDAIAIAGSDIEHDFAKDGPHIITGPVAVRGAEPGDVLRIDVVALTPRVPYAVVSTRHGKGALPDEYPAGPDPDPGATAANPELFRNTSVFTPVRIIDGKERLVMPAGPRHRAVFPLKPFMATMGVAQNTPDRVSSVPPTAAAGNLDIADLGVGARLYVPVYVPGAKFFVGDPHFSQGNAEVSLTAAEGSLRGTFRLTLLKRGSKKIPGNRGTLPGPFGETDDFWIPIGLDPDLDEALRKATREGIAFLVGEFGMTEAGALSYMSAATDFTISQVVDRTKGVHGRIKKNHFVRR